MSIKAVGEPILSPCDICYYTGDKENKKVRVVNEHDLMLCKPCYISTIAIERE